MILSYLSLDIRQVFYSGIHLCATNKEAEKINNRELDKLDGSERTYIAKESGEVAESDRATSRELTLKEHARIMMLINDPEERYQNGSLGTIDKLGTNYINIRLDNGKEISVERHKWEIERYTIVTNANNEKTLEKEVVGTFSQFPIKVAYAITIHKSQRQTFDSINLHPACFTVGQLYVALSRVKSIAGLHLVSPIKEKHLLTSKSVFEFYKAQESTQTLKSRGGKRPGAGRKSKYNTKTITIRVPACLEAEIKAWIDQKMAQ